MVSQIMVIRDNEKMNVLLSKMWKKIKWFQLILILVLVAIMVKSPTILRIQSSYIKCWDSITSFSALSLNAMASHTRNHMSGTSYGVLQAARATCMKVWMSIKKSIISLRAMKSPERIDFAIIWFACRRNLAKETLILFLIPTFFLMSSVTFMLTIRS
jgi:hypothetical protein